MITGVYNNKPEFHRDKVKFKFTWERVNLARLNLPYPVIFFLMDILDCIATYREKQTTKQETTDIGGGSCHPQPCQFLE